MTTLSKSIVIRLLAIVLLALAAGKALAAEGEQQQRQLFKLGAQLWPVYCAQCPGSVGHADGPSAASLATKPQDYTDCAAMQKISDDTMFKVIKGGGAAVGLPGDMPSWSDGLSDPEIHDLVIFIHPFCKKK